MVRVSPLEDWVGVEKRNHAQRNQKARTSRARKINTRRLISLCFDCIKPGHAKADCPKLEVVFSNNKKDGKPS